MTPQKISSALLCFVILYLFSPMHAHAGMAKIFSIFEALMPPAILWAAFVTVWYLAVATVSSRSGGDIGGVPPLPKAIVILMFTAALSLTMIGPAGILYLLLFFPTVTLKAFFPAQELSIRPELVTALRRISIVGILMLAGLIASSIYIHSHRSKAEFKQMLSAPPPIRQLVIDKWS